MLNNGDIGRFDDSGTKVVGGDGNGDDSRLPSVVMVDGAAVLGRGCIENGSS